MPNPRLPGTAFISRLISNRFQIVDPKSSGLVGGDVQPVYVVGAQDDVTGLACKAWSVTNGHIAVAARHSFLGIEVYPASKIEIVVRSITVLAQAATLDFILYGVAQGSMSGGSTLNLSILEGGQSAIVPTADTLQQINDSAGLPVPGRQLDTFRVPTAQGEMTHEYPGGIIIRGGAAIELICTTQNQPINAIFRGTVRPLSA